jgi:Ribonuclease G/E
MSRPAPSPAERCGTCGGNGHLFDVSALCIEVARLRERLDYITRGWHSEGCGSVLSESNVYPCNCHIGIALEALK